MLRIINDPPLDGPTNMARDEAMMLLVGEGCEPPTLRLYQWETPTVSLGYFQPFEAFATLPEPAGKLPVVRRITGGGAILHDQEITYSIALPRNHRLIASNASHLYELAQDAVISALNDVGVVAHKCGETDNSTPSRGPFFCFARRHGYDVLVQGSKLAGSAQRRTRNALLQHGSIILGNRFAQQPSGVIALPYETSVSTLRTALVHHFTRLMGEDVSQEEWSHEALASADDLKNKHKSSDWLTRI